MTYGQFVFHEIFPKELETLLRHFIRKGKMSTPWTPGLSTPVNGLQCVDLSIGLEPEILYTRKTEEGNGGDLQMNKRHL